MADDSDTVPVTGRDCETTDSKAFEPDKEWLDAFQEQIKGKLMNQLRMYARERAHYVAASGHKVDELFERELVQDVVVDTWAGVLRWDPKRCSLRKHLRQAITTRTRKLHDRYIKAPHIYLGERGDDEDDDALSAAAYASQLAEEDASAIVASPDYPLKRVYAREVIAKIRETAASDKDVLRIVDALEAGAETRDDVLALTKMRERTYHNAHIRLMRIVQNVTNCMLAPKARA